MTQQSTVINFTRGVPANESFPIDEVVDAARTALAAPRPAMLQYGPVAGFQPLREWLAGWQGVSVDRVLTGNGSLQLIEFLCLHLLKPGDVVFTESPTYDRTLTLLRRHGATVVGIPLEADGPNIEALERRSRSTRRSSSTSSPTSRTRRARPARARSGGASPSWPSSTGSCSSRTRRTGCCATAARGADALLARARAHAAHELVHEAHRPRRAHRLHDWRAVR